MLSKPRIKLAAALACDALWPELRRKRAAANEPNSLAKWRPFRTVLVGAMTFSGGRRDLDWRRRRGRWLRMVVVRGVFSTFAASQCSPSRLSSTTRPPFLPAPAARGSVDRPGASGRFGGVAPHQEPQIAVLWGCVRPEQFKVIASAKAAPPIMRRDFHRGKVPAGDAATPTPRPELRID